MNYIILIIAGIAGLITGAYLARRRTSSSRRRRAGKEEVPFDGAQDRQDRQKN